MCNWSPYTADAVIHLIIFNFTVISVHAAFPGADPEILYGRWLTGWLPIVNHTGAKGVTG